jgi:predicted metal-dependent peptidase
MSNDDIKEVLSEVENIRKANKALLDLGECDAELYVKDICKVGRNTIMTKDHVNGRGGTSVEPAIAYVNANANLYTAFIYLTDGWVPPPRERCKVPMVTVVTKSGASKAECEKLAECKGFGYVIKTENI